MVVLMNAIAQARSAPASGPKLDNRRVLAGIIDVLIVGVGAAVVLAAGDGLSGDGSDVRGALSAVILGWALYYYFALESGNGQTVGKRLMKLRVVRADGRPAGMREIGVRTILRVVDGFGMYIVGLIVMLVTGERRQRIGDLAASTMVVDASAPAPVAAAVAEPVAEAVEVEAVEAEAAEEDLDEEPEFEAPLATQTITLPSRPGPPETMSDLTDAPEAEETVEEPAMEAEPVVEDEPAVEVEDSTAGFVPVSAPEADEEPLPEVSSPVVESLAEDVAAAQDDGADEADGDDDEPVTVKSVETVSAMDLIMGAAEEDAERDSDSDADEPTPA